MFSDHHGIKREINKEKMSGETLNIWKLKDTLLSNSQTEDKITRATRRYFKLKITEV